MRTKTIVRGGIATIATAALLLFGVASASYAVEPSPTPEVLDKEPDGGPSFRSDGESLLLPAIPVEMLELSDEVQLRYGADPRFSAVEVSPDRANLTIWWHGDRPEDLDARAEKAPFAVTFGEALLLPGDLRAAAARAIASEELGVTSAGPLKDGSGLSVTLSTLDPRSRAAEPSDIERALGVPVTVSEDQGPVPAARQNDIYVLGGARVYRWDSGGLQNGCTTGFPVQNGAQKGMMFAAHCAANGAQIVMWPDNTGPTVYAYGNDGIVAAVSGAHDAAIIRTNWNTEGVYTSTWNSSVATQINGAASPPIGAELCFSGSYSGLVCGNIVEQAGISYTLPVAGGTSVNITTGLRSEQWSSTPAVGNGDSGGPGYMLVNVGGTLKRYAGTIISAIPGDSPGDCTGVPGGPWPWDRKCSPTAYSTPVTGALAYTGWSITAIP